MTLGFYFDQQSCIGCRTCQVACKDRLDIQVAGPRPRRVDSFEAGTYPTQGMFHNSVSCNHCDNPACVAACPVGAMFKDEETGIVLHDAETCIVCQACVSACPYGAPQFYELENRVVKCDTCKDLRDAGMAPECVRACPMRALDFGDLDELTAAHGKACVREIPSLPAADLTGPNLLIVAKDCALLDDFVGVVL